VRWPAKARGAMAFGLIFCFFFIKKKERQEEKNMLYSHFLFRLGKKRIKEYLNQDLGGCRGLMGLEGRERKKLKL